jgi:Inner membrane protein YgaP-like, transmembrane domain
MNPLVKFLVAPAGRSTRIVAGLALIAAGLLVVGGSIGVAVAVVGAVPLLAGTFDLCVFAPLFGYSISGPNTRRAA